MAGMLPGVESARRRRIHQSSGCSTIGRRSSFSLFSSNSASSLLRMRANQVDEKLGQLAREAKERLDERLGVERKPLVQNQSDERRIMNRRSELGRSKKKLTMEQEECAVCLEEFKDGENLLNLPCAHRYHSTCLLPWLHTSSHCPCCRTSIFSFS